LSLHFEGFYTVNNDQPHISPGSGLKPLDTGVIGHFQVFLTRPMGEQAIPGTDLIKCVIDICRMHIVISAPPVPDQGLYDTIYQERFMGLPQDNGDGYKAGSPN
jgi:hypothetical protein